MGNAGVWGNDPGDGPRDDPSYHPRCKRNEMQVKRNSRVGSRGRHPKCRPNIGTKCIISKDLIFTLN